MKLVEEKLKEKTGELKRKNIALKEILSQLEMEKKEVRDSINANTDKLLLPLIKKLRINENSKNAKIYSLLESNIKNMTSDFGGKISSNLIKMSPKEIEVCDLVKNGFESKEISAFLNISIKTVETHRRNIRIKLGLSGKKINLYTYLNSI